jgi:chromosome segregation ATPase
MNAGRVSPSVALSAYAEAWINGAKVVVFGDASSALAERLVERGARHVQVYDVDAARAAEASAASSAKQIAYAALDLAGSALRDGHYDVGIVEDLGLAKGNTKALLEPLERALSRRGLALICSRNPDVSAPLIAAPAVSREGALGYYDFYDAVSQHFEEVRMLGQAAFVGYAIADFSATDASDVRLDTALLPGGAEEPEWFLALASALPVSPDAFSVIQLPLADLDLAGRGDGARAKKADSDVVGAASLARAESAEAQVAALQAELKKREEWMAGLESRATTADQRADDMQAELDRLSQSQRKNKEQVARLEQLLEDERRAKRQLEDGKRHVDDGKRQFDDIKTQFDDMKRQLLDSKRQAEDARRQLEDAKRQLEDARRQVEDAKRHALENKRQAEERVRAQEAELDKRQRRADAEAQRAAELAKEAKDGKQLGARAEQLSSALAESEKKARELSARVAQLSASLAESEKKSRAAAEAGDEDVRAELSQLEATLRERATEVSRLTAALHETERFGRELILRISELEASRPVNAVSPDLQAITQRNAELAADLEAARWTISSLEANVGAAPTTIPGGLPTGGQRRDELPPAEPRAPGAD